MIFMTSSMFYSDDPQRLSVLTSLPEKFHADKHDERDSCQECRRRVGRDVVTVIKRAKDKERGGFRQAAHTAGDDQHGSELSYGTRKRERDAVEQSPANRRQRNVPEGLPRRRAHSV